MQLNKNTLSLLQTLAEGCLDPGSIFIRSRKGTHSAEDVAEVLTGGATPTTPLFDRSYARESLYGSPQSHMYGSSDEDRENVEINHQYTSTPRSRMRMQPPS